MTNDSTLQIELLMKSEQLLVVLVAYLLKNYQEEQWDGTTRELLEEASEHLWDRKIKWERDDD